MRSVFDKTSCTLLLFLALGTGPIPAMAQEAAPPSRQEVQTAREQVRKDPNLGGIHQERSLHFKDMGDWKLPKSKQEPPPPWLIGLARWIADTGRLVIWTLGAIAVALFLVGLRHWIRVRAEVASAKTTQLPSHVRELDIRPESLPDQIGATARAWWQRGEHHAALSLLYRGALSRLVHEHAVPIRTASTEGECVRLAASNLDQARGRFFAQLVEAWQLTVYGARMPESSAVLALCADFDAHWGSSVHQAEAPL